MNKFLFSFTILISFPLYAQVPAPLPTPIPVPVPPLPTPVPVPVVPLSISGPSSFLEGTLAQYTINNPVALQQAAWIVLPVGSGSQYQSPDGTFVFTAPAGQYQLIAATSLNNKISFLTLSITVTSVASKHIAISIFDSTQLTSLPAGQIAVYQSNTISKSLLDHGITYFQYDTHDVIPTINGSSPIVATVWGSHAKAVGLPALVLVNNGKTVGVPLPADEIGVFISAVNHKNNPK
jgi:hypothetical protein